MVRYADNLRPLLKPLKPMKLLKPLKPLTPLKLLEPLERLKPSTPSKHVVTFFQLFATFQNYEAPNFENI